MINESTKKKEVLATAQSNNWFLVDAKGKILGRLSSFLASRLMGKHKPSYTDNECIKDKIVVINAEKVVLTGKKEYKKHYWHTGYPGGIKNKTYKEILNSKNSHLILRNAVKRMLKKGPLSRKQLKNLYVYSKEKHPHSANNPSILNFD